MDVIELTEEDITSMRRIRDDNTNEVAYLITEAEIRTLVGEYSGMDIPIGDWQIGHSHPCCTCNKYNPPSKQDIVAALQVPFHDWFVVDELGIWTYRIDMEDVDNDVYEYLASRFDMAAVGLMNGYITLSEYLESVNTCIMIMDGMYGTHVRFTEYRDGMSIELMRQKKT